MPHAHGPILRSGDNDGQVWQETHARDVVGVPLESLHASLGLIVPNLAVLVVRARYQVRAVATFVVVNAVDALLVALQRKVRRRRVQAPDFHGLVQRCAGECVRVLGVERYHHDVVSVAFERLRVGPLLVPIPHLDQHVVGRRQKDRERRVNRDGADVVGVRLEALDLLHCVVVHHGAMHVVRTGHHPLLAHHELRRAHREIGDLELLDHVLRVVVPDVHLPVVQRRQHPWLRRVHIHALYTVRARAQLPLDVQPHRHRELPALI